MTHIVRIQSVDLAHSFSLDQVPEFPIGWMVDKASAKGISNPVFDDWHAQRFLPVQMSVVDPELVEKSLRIQLPNGDRDYLVRYVVSAQLAYSFDSLADALLFKLTFGGGEA